MICFPPAQVINDLSTPKYEWDRPHGWTQQDAAIIANVSTVGCPYEAAAGSHAIAVLTEWDEFKTYDYVKMYDSMVRQLAGPGSVYACVRACVCKILGAPKQTRMCGFMSQPFLFAGWLHSDEN